MKKIILFLLVTVQLSSGDAYKEMRTYLKKILYEGQQGCLDETEYNNFIEPYLVKAEKRLNTIKYFIAHPQSKLWASYSDLLAKYIVVCYLFNTTANFSHQDIFTTTNEELRAMIRKINNQSTNFLFNSKDEYDAIFNWVEDMNGLYYEQLRKKRLI